MSGELTTTGETPHAFDRQRTLYRAALLVMPTSLIGAIVACGSVPIAENPTFAKETASPPPVSTPQKENPTGFVPKLTPTSVPTETREPIPTKRQEQVTTTATPNTELGPGIVLEPGEIRKIKRSDIVEYDPGFAEKGGLNPEALEAIGDNMPVVNIDGTEILVMPEDPNDADFVAIVSTDNGFFLGIPKDTTDTNPPDNTLDNPGLSEKGGTIQINYPNPINELDFELEGYEGNSLTVIDSDGNEHEVLLTNSSKGIAKGMLTNAPEGFKFALPGGASFRIVAVGK